MALEKFEKDCVIRESYIKAIKQMAADVEENLASYAFYSLDERVKKLQSDIQKLEAKNLAVSCCVDKSSEFNQKNFDDENAATLNLGMDSKAKIRQRMAELSNENLMANQKEIGAQKMRL